MFKKIITLLSRFDSIKKKGWERVKKTLVKNAFSVVSTWMYD